MNWPWLEALRKPIPQDMFEKSALGRLTFLRSVPLWGWLLGGLPILVVGVLGALPVDGPSSSAGTPLDTLALLSGVFLKLVIVVGLIYLCVAVLQRWRGGLAGRVDRRMAVIETTRLSPHQAIHLVRVDDQVLLIGATDQAVTLLAEVDHHPAGQAATAPLQAGSLEFSSLFASQSPSLDR